MTETKPEARAMKEVHQEGQKVALLPKDLGRDSMGTLCNSPFTCKNATFINVGRLMIAVEEFAYVQTASQKRICTPLNPAPRLDRSPFREGARWGYHTWSRLGRPPCRAEIDACAAAEASHYRRPRRPGPSFKRISIEAPSAAPLALRRCLSKAT